MRSGGVHRDLTRTIRWYHAPLRSAFYPAFALVLGCASAPSAAASRSQSGAAKPSTPLAAEVATPEAAFAPWLARTRTWPMVNEQPLLSGHLGRAHRAEIRVNPEARAAYLALVADTQFADGTWLVESLIDADTNSAGPTFAMERRAGNWVYWLLDAAGRVQAEGSLPLCAGCHAGALARPVFGLPRTPPEQESNGTPARSPK